MKFTVTKVFNHSLGWSVAFRQWRASHSHCRFLHGYALAVKLEFSADALDARNWVVDFGGMKTLRQSLEMLLDHKTLVAKDDPAIEWFRMGMMLGTLDLIELEHVGCEQVALVIAEDVEQWLLSVPNKPAGLVLKRCEVWEHDSNAGGVER